MRGALLRCFVVAAIVLGAGATPAAAQPGNYPPPMLRERVTEPTVVLVTMGVGALIWERHGHIALCITGHPNRRVNTCYNYGIGDFAKPAGMAWGFFRGTKSFWVGKQSWPEVYATYADRDRTIWAQRLPLTPEQVQKVVDKLEHDVLEDNKHYAYDHFWDNCTTRVRDVIDNATDGALSKMKGKTDGRTYRDLAREGFYGMRVPLLITDIAMGRVTDRQPTYWERMFLPDYLRDAVKDLWGVEPHVVYARKGPPPLKDGPSGRVIFAIIGLLLTSPVWLTRLFGRFERAGLAMAVIPYSLLGAILWFLAIISPLPYVEWNESCLVFLPLDVALLVLSPERRKQYAKARVAMLGIVAALFVVGVLKQPLWAPILWPLIPNAVVAFWRPEWTRARAGVASSRRDGSKAAI